MLFGDPENNYILFDTFINKPHSQSIFHYNHTAWLDQVNGSGEEA